MDPLHAFASLKINFYNPLIFDKPKRNFSVIGGPETNKNMKIYFFSPRKSIMEYYYILSSLLAPCLLLNINK